MASSLHSTLAPLRRVSAAVLTAAAILTAALLAGSFRAPWFLNENDEFFSDKTFQRFDAETVSELLGYESRQGFFPVSHLFLAFNRSRFGDDPLPFRLQAAALHAGSAWLVFLLALKLRRNFVWGREENPRGYASAVAAAMLYAAHPLFVGPVLWTGHPFACLSTFFSLAALYCFMRARDGVPRYYTPFYGRAVLAFTLAVLSGRAAAGTLLTFAGFDALMRLNRRRPFNLYAAKDYLPFLGIFGAAVFLWVFQFRDFATEKDSASFFRDGNGPLLAHLPLVYFKALFLPIDLGGILEFNPAFVGMSARAAGGALFFLPVAGAIGFARRRPVLSFCLIWILAGLIGQVLPTRDDLTMEPLFLFGAGGAAVLVSSLAAGALENAGAGVRRKTAWAVFLAAFAGLAWLSHTQAALWRSPLEFWRNAARVSPRSARVLSIAGQMEMRDGSPEAGIELLEKATELCRDCGRQYLRLGQAHQRLGRMDDARKAFETAVRAAPEDPLARLTLGTFYYQRGEMERALSELERAKSSKTFGPVAYNIIAKIKRIMENGEGGNVPPVAPPPDLLESVRPLRDGEFTPAWPEE